VHFDELQVAVPEKLIGHRLRPSKALLSKFHNRTRTSRPVPSQGKVHKPSNPPSRTVPSPVSLILLSHLGSGFRLCSILVAAVQLSVARCTADISHGHDAESFSSADCRSVSDSQIIAQYLSWFVVFWSKISIQLTPYLCLLFLLSHFPSWCRRLKSPRPKDSVPPPPFSQDGRIRQRHISG
jgi:hypothetical protein